MSTGRWRVVRVNLVLTCFVVRPVRVNRRAVRVNKALTRAAVRTVPVKQAGSVRQQAAYVLCGAAEAR